VDVIQRAREQIKRRYIHATDHEQNAYESMLKLIGQNEDKDAEITRLKEQLARTERGRDQATKYMDVADNEIHILKEYVGYAQIGSKTATPELYTHLAGRVKG